MRRVPRRQAALLALVVTACGKDTARPPDTTPEPTYLPDTSPENVLENLIVAWNERDEAGYERLLAEDFTFTYNGVDVGPPDTHDSADERCVVHVAFTHPAVDSIWVRMEYGPAIDSDDPDIRRIDVTCCDVGLVGPAASGDATVAYRNFLDPQTFWFRAVTTDDETTFEIMAQTDIEAPCEFADTPAPSAPRHSWGWMKHSLLLLADLESLCE